MIIDKDIFKYKPFEMSEDKKGIIFKNELKKLNRHHFFKCKEYKKMMKILHQEKKINFNDLPPLPVKIFKELSLLSVPKYKIVKQLESSGTTGLNKSRINMDINNSQLQLKTLQKIGEEFLGKKRVPMAFIEMPIESSKFNLSASKAAVTGFSIFGKDRYFLLDKNGNLNKKKLIEFEEKFQDQQNILFGFTYNIYKHLIKLNNSKKINLKNTIVIHGGGWKKLENLKITNNEFNKILKKRFNIKKIINYYGLIEQTGSIFFECEEGFFHTSIFSDIKIVDTDWTSSTKIIITYKLSWS